MIARAREREIDLEMEMKSKPEELSGMEGSGKKPKTDSQGKGQLGRGRCDKCGRSHEGTYRARSSGYFKCGRTGHVTGIVLLLLPLLP